MKKILVLLFLSGQIMFAVDASEIRRPGNQGKDVAMASDKSDSTSVGDKDGGEGTIIYADRSNQLPYVIAGLLFLVVGISVVMHKAEKKAQQNL